MPKSWKVATIALGALIGLTAVIVLAYVVLTALNVDTIGR
jgi:hypothetical protein